MRQIRKNNDLMEEYLGPAMGYGWYEANGYISYAGTLPLSQLDIVDGEIVELPVPEPTGEWVNISDFVGALYELVPAETVAGVLQNPTSLKPAIAGMALLSSDAAPDGRINLADERVAEWLPLVGVTLEQVREALAANPGAEAGAEAEVEAGTETGRNK